MPRRVEHELTETGRTLIEPIEGLTRWAMEHGAAVAPAMRTAE